MDVVDTEKENDELQVWAKRWKNKRRLYVCQMVDKDVCVLYNKENFLSKHIHSQQKCEINWERERDALSATSC